MGHFEAWAIDTATEIIPAGATTSKSLTAECSSKIAPGAASELLCFRGYTQPYDLVFGWDIGTGPLRPFSPQISPFHCYNPSVPLHLRTNSHSHKQAATSRGKHDTTALSCYFLVVIADDGHKMRFKTRRIPNPAVCTEAYPAP